MLQSPCAYPGLVRRQWYIDLAAMSHMGLCSRQGIQASLIGILPYAAIRLGVYDGLKWGHRKYTKREHIPPVPTMLYGAVAGLISASATFPVEVVRSERDLHSVHVLTSHLTSACGWSASLSSATASDREYTIISEATAAHVASLTPGQMLWLRSDLRYLHRAYDKQQQCIQIQDLCVEWSFQMAVLS